MIEQKIERIGVTLVKVKMIMMITNMQTNQTLRKNQEVVEAEVTKSIKSAESAAANTIALANKETKTALDELEADVQQIKDAREAAKVLLVEKKKAIKTKESKYQETTTQYEKNEKQC